MGRRGRKTNTYEKGYFYQTEEDAVIDYINAKTAEEKNLIFEQNLRPAFKKMIESIIRRYNLYPKGEEFEQTFDDALAFIISKIDRYKQEKGRAFSYIQTMCKNHLRGKINDNNKVMVRDVSYDDIVEEINDNESYSYMLSDEESELTTLINSTIEEINEIVHSENSRLNKNEVLVGKSLVEILTNWDELFSDLGSNKFNKTSILQYIKETTNLSTKDVRNSMRKFKNVYFKTKQTIF